MLKKNLLLISLFLVLTNNVFAMESINTLVCPKNVYFFCSETYNCQLDEDKKNCSKKLVHSLFLSKQVRKHNAKDLTFEFAPDIWCEYYKVYSEVKLPSSVTKEELDVFEKFNNAFSSQLQTEHYRNLQLNPRFDDLLIKDDNDCNFTVQDCTNILNINDKLNLSRSFLPEQISIITDLLNKNQ